MDQKGGSNMQYTIKIILTEEESNSLTTILEDKNMSEKTYFAKAILEKLTKDLAKYKQFC